MQASNLFRSSLGAEDRRLRTWATGGVLAVSPSSLKNAMTSASRVGVAYFSISVAKTVARSTCLFVIPLREM